ncbi:unnamed protein product [Cochlearia groenlandica]
MIGHVLSGGIRIANEFKDKRDLWMSCYEEPYNTVISPRIIKPGGHFSHVFQTLPWGTTRYTCVLRHGPRLKHYQSFKAFRCFDVKDTGGNWDWRARENGIYLKKPDGWYPMNMHKALDWENID